MKFFGRAGIVYEFAAVTAHFPQAALRAAAGVLYGKTKLTIFLNEMEKRFSNILKRNNDYSETFDFRQGTSEREGGGHIFHFGGPW